MTLRALIVGLSFLACAVWPQGLVLCVEPDGHVEFEIEGSPCCPSEAGGGGECTDCDDIRGTDLVGPTVAPDLAAPLAATQKPGIVPVESSTNSLPFPPLSGLTQQPVVLLI